MNLPNLLSLVRVLLIPVFIILIIYKLFEWALVTFAVAGITDGVDGLLARLTRQKTELGAYLDPIADKLLLSSSFIVLAIIKMLPSWLAVIVLTRDVIIALGFFVFLLTNKRPSIRPSFISKLTTTFQISTILLFLTKGYSPILQNLSHIAVYGTVFFTVLSGAHYICLGTKILNEKGS